MDIGGVKIVTPGADTDILTIGIIMIHGTTDGADGDITIQQ